jgi:serine-threonine kinase receptor-associated protein
VRAADISYSQDLLATGGHEKRIRLFDLKHPTQSRDIGRHDSTVKSVVWDRSDLGDNIIISSGDDKRVVWWDRRSSAPAAEYTVDDAITSMEQSIDHCSITVTAGKIILIFDSASYHPLSLPRI